MGPGIMGPGAMGLGTMGPGTMGPGTRDQGTRDQAPHLSTYLPSTYHAGPDAKTLIFHSKSEVFYTTATRRQRGGNAAATRRQRGGNAPAPPRERQLGPSPLRTQQEPFASRSWEKSKKTMKIDPKSVATARNGLKLGQNGSEWFQDAISISFDTFSAQ